MYDNTRKTIGHILKLYRLKAHFTQVKAAEMLKIPQTKVADAERGRTPMTTETIKKYIELYNIDDATAQSMLDMSDDMEKKRTAEAKTDKSTDPYNVAGVVIKNNDITKDADSTPAGTNNDSATSFENYIKTHKEIICKSCKYTGQLTGKNKAILKALKSANLTKKQYKKVLKKIRKYAKRNNSRFIIEIKGYYYDSDKIDTKIITGFDTEESAITKAYKLCDKEIDRLNKGYCKKHKNPFEQCDGFVANYDGTTLDCTVATVFNDDGDFHAVTLYTVKERT